MAASAVEEKILGRLSRQTAPSNPLLSASLYQVLGLSILLSRKLIKARRVRKLDTSRDTKSLQLYHHIIWLAREGLSITEVYILPYCQDGEQGPECRVMAAKLRASLYHIFCLFHNHPRLSQLSPRSGNGNSPPSRVLTPKANNGQVRKSPGKSPKNGRDGANGRQSRRGGALRDPIPSITSDTSYVTNPYASIGPAQTPPPPGPPPPIPPEARRAPARPPGLAPINISPTQATASFLLPPLNFVPMACEHFDTVQHLANNLLPPANALRLSVSLEHAAFLQDCDKDFEQARRIGRKAIKAVYASSEGLDDEEFADAAALVQSLGGIVRRAGGSATSKPSKETLNTTTQQPVLPEPTKKSPKIDRTIPLSPPPTQPTSTTQGITSPSPSRGGRLSTVPEVSSRSHTSASSHAHPTSTAAVAAPRPETIRPTNPASNSGTNTATNTATPSGPPSGAPTSITPPTTSRMSPRSGAGEQAGRRSAASTASHTTSSSAKTAKRRAVEEAEAKLSARQRTGSGSRHNGNGSGGGRRGDRNGNSTKTREQGSK